MLTYTKKALIAGIAFTAPLFAFAVGGIQTPGNTPLTQFVRSIYTIVRLLVPIVSLLAVIYFFYGLAKYVLSAGDEEKAQEGKSIMIWGVLAMFVLVAIWGIVGFIQSSIGANIAPDQVNIILPDVNPSTAGPGVNNLP